MTEWRKSSHSNNGQCVEVATNLPGVVAVRDSQNPGGGHLKVSRRDWREFLASLGK